MRFLNSECEGHQEGHLSTNEFLSEDLSARRSVGWFVHDAFIINVEKSRLPTKEGRRKACFHLRPRIPTQLAKSHLHIAVND